MERRPPPVPLLLSAEPHRRDDCAPQGRGRLIDTVPLEREDDLRSIVGGDESMAVRTPHAVFPATGWLAQIRDPCSRGPTIRPLPKPKPAPSFSPYGRSHAAFGSYCISRRPMGSSRIRVTSRERFRAGWNCSTQSLTTIGVFPVGRRWGATFTSSSNASHTIRTSGGRMCRGRRVRW